MISWEGRTKESSSIAQVCYSLHLQGNLWPIADQVPLDPDLSRLGAQLLVARIAVLFVQTVPEESCDCLLGRPDLSPSALVSVLLAVQSGNLWQMRCLEVFGTVEPVLKI
ncbi:hypothetical protein lerEdw1_010783 [Lerista edwardsae]|nr:hypothetical protein lerEdw1_010783 [Lerista edwardsae]